MRTLKSFIENQVYLGQIAENIGQVIWLSDCHSGRILYVSPSFENVWGRSCDDLYTHPEILIECVHPEDRLQVMVATPPADHKPFNQAFRIVLPDGKVRWIFSRTFLVRNEDGDPDFLFYIAQDITEQKQVELALRTTLDRTREQFNLSRKMSLAHKPEAVLKILMTALELRSAKHSVLLFFDDPKDGPAHGVEMTAAWFARQNDSSWANESVLYEEPAFWELLQPNRMLVMTGISSENRLAPQVREILMDYHVQTLVIFPLVALGKWLGNVVVYYEQEHPIDHIGLHQLKVLVDQAATTLYNLQLLNVEEELRREAERATEIKTEFLAMISHELRTPLTSIIGFTTTLMAEDVSWDVDEQQDFIQTIQLEANRLQALINHLLDLSSLEAGMLPIAPQCIALQKIVEDVLPQIHTLTQEQTFSMHLPADLPLVQVDANRIGQVIVNLVRNSSSYAPKGTEISLSASVRGNFLQVNVSDQGPGIPKTEHLRVFKAFQRGKNMDKNAAQGAGLGLAICKGLVEAHGGRIWIKNKSMPGATVCFTIPLAPFQASMTGVEKE